MVVYRRDEIVSETELAKHLAELVERLVEGEKEKIAIVKEDRLEAIMLDIETYESLKAMEARLQRMGGGLRKKEGAMPKRAARR